MAGRNGRIAPWAGDFRPATDARSPKDAVGKTFTLEMPDAVQGVPYSVSCAVRSSDPFGEDQFRVGAVFTDDPPAK